MIIIGVDPGQSSFAAVGLHPSSESMHTLRVQAPAPPTVAMGGGLRSERLHWLMQGAEQMTESLLSRWQDDDRDNIVYAFIEEPPLAGARNLRTYGMLHQAVSAIACGITLYTPRVYFIPVSTWKKAMCDSGSASKTQVAVWLTTVHPNYAARCDGSQDLIDACTIALYGLQATAAAELVRTIGSAGDL